MHLYRGSTEQFIGDATRARIAGMLSDRFFDHFRFRPAESEIRAWQNSLRAMAQVLQVSSLDRQGILVELQLPLTSKRLDCMITGTQEGKPSATVVELKQWDWVGDSPIPDCVVTSLGGRDRDVLHPSVQVGAYEQYLVDMHPAFATGRIAIGSCAYLHNLTSAKAGALDTPAFASRISRSPAYTGDQFDDLSNHLIDVVGGPDDGSVMQAIITTPFSPQKRLLDHAARVIRSEPVFVLLDEQRIAYNAVLAAVDAARTSGRQTAVLVRGGPGTGKSVIAVHLVATLGERGATVAHATGSLAFTENLRKTVGARAAKLFTYFRNLASVQDAYDCIVLDEAHRIRAVSTNRFTRAADRSGKAQIEEIFDAARVPVFFIDDYQVVRPGEVGTSALIRETAEARGMPLQEFELEAQFRSSGSDAYIQWVDNTLGIRRTPHTLWDPSDQFDLRIVGSPAELEASIRARAASGHSARMTAGFCWTWSDPAPDGTLVSDVTVGAWSMPWNARPEVTRLAAGIPKSHFWASDPNGIDQVGCVYTAQGFEFDYAGVIVGDDLVWRPGQGWIGRPEFSRDSTVRRAREGDRSFTEYAQNTYRVLLTRGLKGCYIYFTDAQTRDFVQSRIDQPVTSYRMAAEAKTEYTT